MRWITIIALMLPTVATEIKREFCNSKRVLIARVVKKYPAGRRTRAAQNLDARIQARERAVESSEPLFKNAGWLVVRGSSSMDKG